jgi:Family of unknown function (DUF6188)
LEGCVVGQCCVDWALTLRLSRGQDSFDVCIARPFNFDSGTGDSYVMNPEDDPVGLGPILEVGRTGVAEAWVMPSGALRMTFHDGSRMNVPACDGFEAWSLSASTGLRVVCGPAGEVTTWTPPAAQAAAGEAAGAD